MQITISGKKFVPLLGITNSTVYTLHVTEDEMPKNGDEWISWLVEHLGIEEAKNATPRRKAQLLARFILETKDAKETTKRRLKHAQEEIAKLTAVIRKAAKAIGFVDPKDIE